MATSRSKVGQAGASVPKSSKQGSNVAAHKQQPHKSGIPGGFMKTPGSLASPKRKGVHVKAKSGSGTGARKGNSLPR